MLARGLAGVQLGACTSLVFAYCSVSIEKYTKNLEILGKYEKKKAERVKGYVFSLFIVGNSLGFAIGIGKVRPLYSITTLSQLYTLIILQVN